MWVVAVVLRCGCCAAVRCGCVHHKHLHTADGLGVWCWMSVAVVGPVRYHAVDWINGGHSIIGVCSTCSAFLTATQCCGWSHAVRCHGRHSVPGVCRVCCAAARGVLARVVGSAAVVGVYLGWHNAVGCPLRLVFMMFHRGMMLCAVPVCFCSCVTCVDPQTIVPVPVHVHVPVPVPVPVRACVCVCVCVCVVCVGVASVSHTGAMKVVVGMLGLPVWLAAPAAVASAVVAMEQTRTMHPPAAATALIAVIGTPAVHSLGYLFVVAPCGAGPAILVGLGLLLNNLRQGVAYPKYWW